MERDLTKGRITSTMLRFAVPMIIGDLLQQLYNVVDTLIVGKFVGRDALAAVGSSYTLMTFLTSILLGLCMGSGTVFSMYYGGKNTKRLKKSISTSFIMIALCAIVLSAVVFIFIDPIMGLLQVPEEIYPMMRNYLWIIFTGICATFLYNFFASLLRALGNSLVPLLFLGISAIMNIALDLVFVLVFKRGVAGAAEATVISQYVSGIGITLYTLIKHPDLRPDEGIYEKGLLRELSDFSFLTCLQQSIMNFGILMVQGLINSFGIVVMAAFAAAVKIDSFAYMPVQDFGNAFSTFIAQNYGAGKAERIRKGMRSAALCAAGFCLLISLLVCLLARPLMGLFIDASRTDIIAAGVGYLRIEASFYIGIGLLFLFYGFYRAVGRPGISVALTVISLGTRVALAYLLSALPAVGVTGIWVSVPIGWLLADLAGALYYIRHRKVLLGG